MSEIVLETKTSSKDDSKDDNYLEKMEEYPVKAEVIEGDFLIQSDIEEPSSENTLDNSHGIEKSFLCHICHKSYAAKRSLNRHQRITHNLIPCDLSEKCDICGKEFKDNESLKCHMTIHTGERPFLCDICNMSFRLPKHLRRHKNNLHNMERKKSSCPFCNEEVFHLEIHIRGKHTEHPYSCDKCSKSFTTEDKLAGHKNKFHSGAKVCEICNKQFKFRSTLKEHTMQVHTGERPFPCDFCGKRFVTKAVLNTHRKKRHGQKTIFRCKSCNQVFLSKLARAQHKQLRHSKHSEVLSSDGIKAEYEDMSNNYDCNDPTGIKKEVANYFDGVVNDNNNPFEPAVQIKEEVKNENNDSTDPTATSDPQIDNKDAESSSNKIKKSFSCYICDKSYASKKSLNLHQRIHTGEKLIPCDLCEKSFTTSTQFKLHMRRHTGEKPFSCDKCSESFLLKTLLNKHQKVHTGNLYHCDTCEQSFELITQLNAHKKLHLAEIPIICEICEESFSERAILKKHIARVHNTGEDVFPCNTCGKIFYKKYHLTTHEIVHSGEKPFSCEVCERSFNRKDGLTRHYKLVHGKPFSCEICKKSYDRKDTLTRHYKLVHGNESVSTVDSTNFVDCGEYIGHQVKEELEIDEEVNEEMEIEEGVNEEKQEELIIESGIKEEVKEEGIDLYEPVCVLDTEKKPLV